MVEQVLVRLEGLADATVAEQFELLVNAVGASGLAGADWKALRARDAGGSSRADDPERVHLVHELLPRVRELCDDEPTHLLACSALPCHRLHSGSAEPGAVGLWAEVRDTGDAREVGLRLFSCGPFCAELGEVDAQAQSRNAFVAENLEKLTQLCFSLIGALDPARLRVHTESGAPWPLNAHLAYCRGADAAREELTTVTRLAPSMADHGGPDREWWLHPWRSDGERERLADLLGAAPRDAALPSDERIEEVLRSGAFDVYDLPSGWAVLEHPWFLNGFVDRFWLALAGAPSAE